MLSVPDVEQLLCGSLGFDDVDDLSIIGRGAWSTAFGFTHEERSLVVRIGRHVVDFRRDEAMAAFATAGLPIPEVLSIGPVPSDIADDLHYCISTRALGTPLESQPATDWPNLVERVTDALEAMRAISPTPDDRTGHTATTSPWRTQLTNIRRDDLDPRGASWPAKLALSERGADAFEAGFARLAALDIGAVPLTLVHGDLINRNVHVDDGRITGIFDWGCQRWGDHLFDLAWFEFWSPWHSNLDVDLLRASLHRRWAAAGYEPDRETERGEACLIYVGLEHLIYNATIDGWDDLDDVVDRMIDLDLL